MLEVRHLPTAAEDTETFACTEVFHRRYHHGKVSIGDLYTEVQQEHVCYTEHRWNTHCQPLVLMAMNGRRAIQRQMSIGDFSKCPDVTDKRPQLITDLLVNFVCQGYSTTLCSFWRRLQGHNQVFTSRAIQSHWVVCFETPSRTSSIL